MPTILCPCGTKIETSNYQLKRKRYCSKACMYKYRVRPTGLHYKLTKQNPTVFKKGNIPWNVGIPCSNSQKENLRKKNSGKRLSVATEFTSERTRGSNNSKWKGDDVGYGALHCWIARHRKKENICEHCGIKTRTEFANKSHEYKRSVHDWLELCKRCHCKYDKNKWGYATKKFNLNK